MKVVAKGSKGEKDEEIMEEKPFLSLKGIIAALGLPIFCYPGIFRMRHLLTEDVFIKNPSVQRLQWR